MPLDAIIIGGGAAGLSAALVLGRSRRSVMVIDAGRPRNHAALHMHNFPSRDGIDPRRFLSLARKDAARYNVEFQSGVVSSAICRPGGFAVKITSGPRLLSRTLLLATGVVDILPAIPNVRNFYGRGVHHCPYCDAFEYHDQPIAAYGPGTPALGLAMSLLTWSKNITAITDGAPLDAASLRTARRLGIAVRTEQVSALLSRRGKLAPSPRDPLARITFIHGEDLPVSAMFFNTDKVQRSKLPIRLGCTMNEDGGVVHDRRQRTGVPGLYLAGDASFDVQFVIVAAAEGAKAGVAMNRELQERDRAAILNQR